MALLKIIIIACIAYITYGDLGKHNVNWNNRKNLTAYDDHHYLNYTFVYYQQGSFKELKKQGWHLGSLGAPLFPPKLDLR